MKTDHPIYLFLSAGAEAFRVLTGGHELAGPYRFCSLTIKGLERRLDGLFEPEGHSGPVYVVEFQGQRADKAWYNLLTKIGLYGEEHPQRDVIGVGIFLRETAKEVWAMLNLVTPIQETKAYQSIFAEGRDKGWAEGRDKGWAEGEAQGLAKGKADSLKHLLRRRFDAVPAWAAQRIDAASIAQLDAWLDGIFDASSVEALIGTERN